jgi:hypothetical protein
LSETTRVAIVHVHEQSVSVYESFLDQIERIVELSPPTMPGELDRLHRGKSLSERGSSGRDDDDEYQRVAWRRRFYSDASADLVPILAARSINAIVLLGTPHIRELFEDVAPRSLIAKLIATAPGVPRLDARPAQILAGVRDLIDEHQRKSKLALATKLSEHGVVGLDDCLTKLQRGQLRTIFVPWDLRTDLFVELDTGWVASSPGQARALSGACNARVAPVGAVSKLVELADRHSTDVEFIRSGRSDSPSPSPFDAIQAVAGLPRWL